LSLLDYNIFFDLVNFLILMYLLHRFLYKPVLGKIDERREKIQDDLERARRERKNAEEYRSEYENKLAQAEEEARAVIDRASKKAREQAEEIVNQAREEGRREKQRVQEEIRRAQNEARAQLRDEVAGLSLRAAGRFLEEKLSEEDHRELMERVVAELPDERLGDQG